MTFETLEAALRAGFTVYDVTADGYVVRAHTAAGYALALVPRKDSGAKAA